MSKFGKMINTSNKLSNHIAFTVALLPKYSIWQYIISFAWHLPSKFYQEFYLSAPNFKTMCVFFLLSGYEWSHSL